MAVDSDGLFAKAGEATNKWNEAVGRDDEQLEMVFQELAKDEYIGKYVHYNKDLEIGESGVDDDWRVFWIENGYTYLIASNYVKNSLVPKTTTGDHITGLTETKGDYSIWWTKTSGVNDGPNLKTRTLTNAAKYKLSWRPNTNDGLIVSDHGSAKAVAQLLDEEAWSDFALPSVDSRIKAVGAPTIELWVASYNLMNPSSKLYLTYNDIGYSISSTNNPPLEEEASATIDASNTLYVLPASGDGLTTGYWIASPQAGNTLRLMRAVGAGEFATGFNGNNRGIRPIVCIPSSIIGRDENSGKEIYYVDDTE